VELEDVIGVVIAHTWALIVPLQFTSGKVYSPALSTAQLRVRMALVLAA
jgi:hypothetical protein